MVSRREFLRAGSIAGAFSLVPGGVALARKAETGRPRLAYDAIVDTRFSEGNQFLSAIHKTAFQAQGVTHDPGVLLRVLPEAFEAGRVVVGLTPDATLMIAEQLAAEHGYLLNYRGLHIQQSDSALVHRVMGERRWVAEFGQALAEAADEWPALLGEFAGALVSPARSRQELEVMANVHKRAHSPGRLISWALAPRIA